MRRAFCVYSSTLFALLAAGCTSAKMTHTARTGTEQLLISNAVDQTLDRTDFRAFQGQNVYLEEKYIDCVDKAYIIGSIRHRALTAGANLVGKPEEADVVMEVRSGSVGTDTKDTFLGMPALQLPGPLPVSIPEIRMMSRTSQTGMAKIGIVAYDAKTKQVQGNGGVALARSDDNNWFVLGIGPYQNGSVRTEVSRNVGVSFPQASTSMPTNIAFNRREPEPGEPDRVRLTGKEASAEGDKGPAWEK